MDTRQATSFTIILKYSKILRRLTEAKNKIKIFTAKRVHN